MRKLSPPQVCLKEVFDACVAINPNGDVSKRCRTAWRSIVYGNAFYRFRGAKAQLFKFKSGRKFVGLATKKDLTTLYGRLRDRDIPRKLYDRIRANGAPGKCPYCGSGQIGTLDHYLSKQKYPLFATAPLNLVPSCERCNTTKSENVVRRKDKQFLHPYFDDFNDLQWLYARINEHAPVSAEFYVDAPGIWSSVKKTRIAFHFKELDLAPVFITNAAEELTGISEELSDILSEGTYLDVRRHLQRRAKSFKSMNINSWQTALYQACATSDWFCNGGFAENSLRR